MEGGGWGTANALVREAINTIRSFRQWNDNGQVLSISCCSYVSENMVLILALFLHFRRKARLTKWVSLSLSLSLSLSVCVCKILVHPNNFQTSYPTETKFWLHRPYSRGLQPAARGPPAALGRVFFGLGRVFHKIHCVMNIEA